MEKWLASCPGRKNASFVVLGTNGILPNDLSRLEYENSTMYIKHKPRRRLIYSFATLLFSGITLFSDGIMAAPIPSEVPGLYFLKVPQNHTVNPDDGPVVFRCNFSNPDNGVGVSNVWKINGTSLYNWNGRSITSRNPTIEENSKEYELVFDDHGEKYTLNEALHVSCLLVPYSGKALSSNNEHSGYIHYQKGIGELRNLKLSSSYRELKWDSPKSFWVDPDSIAYKVEVTADDCHKARSATETMANGSAASSLGSGLVSAPSVLPLSTQIYLGIRGNSFPLTEPLSQNCEYRMSVTPYIPNTDIEGGMKEIIEHTPKGFYRLTGLQLVESGSAYFARVLFQATPENLEHRAQQLKVFYGSDHQYYNTSQFDEQVRGQEWLDIELDIEAGRTKTIFTARIQDEYGNTKSRLIETLSFPEPSIEPSTTTSVTLAGDSDERSTLLTSAVATTVGVSSGSTSVIVYATSVLSPGGDGASDSNVDYELLNETAMVLGVLDLLLLIPCLISTKYLVDVSILYFRAKAAAHSGKKILMDY